jgi:hypothetical protein
MFYRDNWLSWKYSANIEYGVKQFGNDPFFLKLTNMIDRPVKSYYEELVNNAKMLRDVYTGKFDLLFSGGIDSEVILRLYLDLKIPINVFIFKYENDYNYKDYNQAIATCNALGVTPTVIDFNLKKFFENDAYDIWKTVHFLNAGRLPHMKMIEYLDGIPIMGDGNPEWICVNGEWKWVFAEIDTQWISYCNLIGRTAITNWYEYSPEIAVSYTKEPVVQQLFTTSQRNSRGIKCQLHQQFWPDLASRDKLIGFEGNMPAGEYNSKPKFMLEFNNQYIINKLTSQECRFSQDELTNLLVDKTYL